MSNPFAAPVEIPLDVPVALRAAEPLPLVKARLGHITTTAYRSSTRRSVTRPSKPVLRVRQHHVDWIDDRLSGRDRAIMATVGRLRLVSGAQLERVHFAELSEDSRARDRRRVLSRLCDWRVLTSLQRRIGGVRAGSAVLVFALDSAGQMLAPRSYDQADRATKVRRSHTPRVVWLKHTLAISELYVTLVEYARARDFDFQAFVTEPACWWPNGLGGWLRDDAYFRLAASSYSDAWWLEQDMYRLDQHSEDLTSIRRKLLTYLDFVERGQLGPHGIVPRVLINVTDAKRQAAILGVIERLPHPASKLFHVTTHDQAVSYLLRVLHA
jgi:hypothetical protein